MFLPAAGFLIYLGMGNGGALGNANTLTHSLLLITGAMTTLTPTAASAWLSVSREIQIVASGVELNEVGKGARPARLPGTTSPVVPLGQTPGTRVIGRRAGT